ncbi:PTS fructose transporter subunit IIB [Clostridium ganghwense]|uniref:PTS fructose transporter subunit IIB n=1 Tax=Clostridium ganghwense TaxID=312089 RepID=A0ABT4CJX9_9CLOT|nr:PTS fructose transporter subunit IIB [Clostridium ganghwense]MCY6369354.1 PTS fructose transporter subunit IIB [Clostridium ganghwense]
MKIVGVTACPTGVAHTNMAAKALVKTAEKLGHIIKVEKQGALGIQNRLTKQEIEDADVVIFAVEQKVREKERFTGKIIHQVPVAAPIKNGVKVIEDALNLLK